jgi:hypothetical protein
MPITHDDFAEGVSPPGPGDTVGWVVRDGDGRIVDWGPLADAQMIGATSEEESDGRD